MPNKIAMVIAQKNFRDEEYWIPKMKFEQAGFEVLTISTTEEPAISKFGKLASIDLTLDNLRTADFDVLLLVGGPGCQDYFDNATVHQLAATTLEKNKLLTAICSAPVILAKAGLLTGKRATGFPGDAELLKAAGVHYTGEQLTEDGNLITANGPEAAQVFAESIINHMT